MCLSLTNWDDNIILFQETPFAWVMQQTCPCAVTKIKTVSVTRLVHLICGLKPRYLQLINKCLEKTIKFFTQHSYLLNIFLWIRAYRWIIAILVLYIHIMWWIMNEYLWAQAEPFEFSGEYFLQLSPSLLTKQPEKDVQLVKTSWLLLFTFSGRCECNIGSSILFTAVY
jgi:hypothetical protein